MNNNQILKITSEKFTIKITERLMSYNSKLMLTKNPLKQTDKQIKLQDDLHQLKLDIRKFVEENHDKLMDFIGKYLNHDLGINLRFYLNDKFRIDGDNCEKLFVDLLASELGIDDKYLMVGVRRKLNKDKFNLENEMVVFELTAEVDLSDVTYQIQYNYNDDFENDDNNNYDQDDDDNDYDDSYLECGCCSCCGCSCDDYDEDDDNEEGNDCY